MINFSALDLKASVMDITSKNMTTNEKQADFQDTLKSNLDFEKRSVTKTGANDKIEKKEPLSNQSINKSNKEIPFVEENVDVTSDLTNTKQLENKILLMISEALGIDLEQLKEVLESLDLESTDLLSLEHLQSLILQLTGNESMIQLLAQPTEVTGPITDLISEISKLSADETVQKIVFSDNTNSFAKSQEMGTNQVQEVGELFNENQPKTVESGQAQNQEGVSIQQNSEGNVINTTNFDEQLNHFAQNSEGKDSGKNDAGETKKTLLTSDELIQNLTKFTQNVQGTDKLDQVIQGNVVDYVEVVEQIVEQIKVSIKPEVTTMEMQLNPESLGRLNLEISSKDGVLKAQFTVQDQVVKEALESQMTQLKETLSAQGLKIESIEVKLSNLAYDPNGHKQQQEQQQQKKRYHLQDQDSEDEGTIIEEIRRDLEIQKSTMVDYSA